MKTQWIRITFGTLGAIPSNRGGWGGRGGGGGGGGVVVCWGNLSLILSS